MSEALDAVESRWERSVPLPKIDAAMLAAHLAPWPELRGRAWTVLGGGLRSLNLRCDERVLRIGSELGKEAALLRLAAELGVRVPRVLDESPTALLLEFVPHEPLPATEAAGRKVAEAAVRIHGHRFEHAGMLGADLRVSEPFAGRLDGLLAWAQGLLSGIAGERLGAERRAALEALWREHDAALRDATRASVLVHSDFKPTNIHWLPDEADVLVLDWEFAWSGPGLYDLGMVLRWSPPEPFVRGLEAATPDLPKDWRRLAELLDLFNLVGFMDATTARSRRDRDVLRRIDRTLGQG
ncbi:MAG: aminoglycoside phosphotransferase family protein [Myxococcales bacterium]|nr:aminoglycoside phosphotransferase family protein [Myxococcales bacterium]